MAPDSQALTMAKKIALFSLLIGLGSQRIIHRSSFTAYGPFGMQKAFADA